ncbi:hypothetical protein ACFU7T_32960 [Streptomyces sp. NPDC057555]
MPTVSTCLIAASLATKPSNGNRHRLSLSVWQKPVWNFQAIALITGQ